MNRLIRLVSIALALTLAALVHAQDVSSSGTVAAAVVAGASTQSQTQPQPTAAPKIDYKDAFLSLALQKAKLYSGKAEDALASGIDLATKTAPELAREFCAWRAWKHGLSALPGVLMSLFAIIAIPLGFRAGKRNEWEDFPALLAVGGLSGIMALCAMPAWGAHILDFVQVLTAPRIYMLEQLAHAFGR